MTSSSLTIDFANIEGPVYTGRDRGERLRTSLHLDEADAEQKVVEVKIPSSTYTMSSSFFLGLFGPSVIRAGTKANFYQRYRFSMPSFLGEVMDSYVSRALQSRKLFN